MESEKTLRKSSSFCWDKKHLPPTIGWPCWNGNICRVHSLPCYWLWCLKSSRYVTDKIICRRSMRKGLMAAITLKLHVAQVKDGGEQFKNLPGICLWEGEDLQSWAEVSKLLYVVSPFTACAVSLMEGLQHLKLNIVWFTLNEVTQLNKSFIEMWLYHGQILVISCCAKRKNLLLVCWHAHQHVVKDVVVSFLRRLLRKSTKFINKTFSLFTTTD